MRSLHQFRTMTTLAPIRCTVFDTQPYTVRSFDLALSRLKQENPRFKDLEIAFKHTTENLNESTAVLAQGSNAVCLFVNDEVPEGVAGLLHQAGVRLLLLRCAGFDRVNIRACNQAEISVARVPAYSPHAVAEFAAGLLLSSCRKIHKAYMKTRSGDFRLTRLVGSNLHGKTVGVFGTGKIGKCFVNIMLGFGCKVLCYDSVEDPAVRALPNVSYTTKEEVFRRSDIVSLHLPLTPSTHHLVNKDTLSLMKPGGVLVNTSRGGLVDTEALLEALSSRHLAEAALDVYERESQYFFREWADEVMPDKALSQLLHLPNVLVTGHQAFLTVEALDNIATTTLTNILEFAEGKRFRELTNSLDFN